MVAEPDWENNTRGREIAIGMITMVKKPDQKTLKRWFDKHLYWVYEKICPVCGSAFYTQFSEHEVCANKTCQAKWKKGQQNRNGLGFIVMKINVFT